MFFSVEAKAMTEEKNCKFHCKTNIANIFLIIYEFLLGHCQLHKLLAVSLKVFKKSPICLILVNCSTLGNLGHDLIEISFRIKLA